MDVNFLPDQELAKAATTSVPGIPGWLAAATLKSRQNVRATTAAPPPTGTVTGDLVKKTMMANGIPMDGMPGAGDSTGQDQSPMSQPSQPAGYARGGLVDRYSGKDGDSLVSDGGIASNDVIGGLENAGLVPKETHFDAPAPVQYNPSMRPDTGGIASDVKTAGSMYGQAPDFAGQQAGVDAIAKRGHQDFGTGDYIQSLVGHILSGTSVDNVKNFGAGLVATNDQERGIKQTNFDNEMKAQAEKRTVQNEMLKRQADIASTARELHQTNAQMADAQAAEQAATDSGNRDAAQRAKQMQVEYESKRAEITQRAAQAITDPAQAALLLSQARAKGDLQGAALWESVAKQDMQAKQSEQDIKTNSQLKVERQSAANQMALAGAVADREKSMAVLKANMDYGPLGIHYDKEGNMQQISKSAVPDGVDPSGVGLSVDAKPGEIKGYDGSNQIDNAALEWLKDPASLQQGKMAGSALAKKRSDLAQARATELMRTNGLDQDAVGIMRVANKDNKAKDQSLQKQLAASQGASGKVDAQLDQLSAKYRQLNSHSVNLNQPNDVKSVLGLNNNEYSSLVAGITTLATEQARAVKGSNMVGEQDIKDQQKIISKYMSSGAFDQVARQIRFDNHAAQQSYEDGSANFRYATHFDQLIKAAHGEQPNPDPLVAMRDKLPKGTGKAIPDDTARQFIKAAKAQLGSGASVDQVAKKAKFLMYAKGWEVPE